MGLSDAERKLFHELVIQGANDELEMGWIVRETKRMFPVLSAPDRRDLICRCIGELLARELAVIKDYRYRRDPKWITWDGSPDEVTLRLKSEWEALGRDPEFPSGEIGWLFLTAKGDSLPEAREAHFIFKKYQNIRAPILPGVGLAGIRLGQAKAKIISILGDPLKIGESRVVGDTVSQSLDYGCIAINLQNDVAVEVIAERGYMGSTEQGLKVNDPWSRALSLYPGIMYNFNDYGRDQSGMDAWCVSALPGMYFMIQRPLSEHEKSLRSPEKRNEKVSEVYRIQDPEHAVVASIAVTGMSFGPDWTDPSGEIREVQVSGEDA